MKVKFENVGRERKTWTSDVATLADYVLRREMRLQKALSARLVDIHWLPGGTEAAIVDGSLRKVGHLRVEGGAKVL